MQLRKKILSHFLLATYLLVVVHHSASQSYSSETAGSSIPASHQHEDYKTVHHEHHFHVGVFHFLGHLFKNIDYSNNLGDEYLTFSQKKSTTKNISHSQSIDFYFSQNNLVVFSLDVESLPDPPFHLSVLRRLKQTKTPQRGPPAAV